MPNHCAGKLVVTGPVEDIEEFGLTAMSVSKEKNALTGKEKEVTRLLDLNNFVPMPEELRNTQAPFRGTQEESKRLRAKYGYDNWYDWSIANWGTKWGVYDTEIHKEQNVQGPLKGKRDAAVVSVVYGFSTAWGPFRAQVLEEMSKRFPRLRFEYTYAEAGSGFWGYKTASAGMVDDDQSYEVKTTKGLSDEIKELLGRSG